MSKKFLSIHNHCSKSKLALAIQILMCCEAIAAPIGGEIVGGTGTITQQGSETAIIQDTERLAIDWQNFDVGKDERVTFVQPGQSAIALNRILSDKGSEILGQIDANGHVILVNPQGVVFKEGAVVNAGGLIASGLQINPDDFMNGDLIFKHLEGTDGAVINSGTINAAAGGNVALIGTQVENRGLISAHLSTVTLSSGKGAVLSFDDAGLLSVKVNEAMLQSELGNKAAVTNAGKIQAEGGRVLLSANTTRDVFSQAVNWGDRQQARSVTYNDDGSFTLGAGGDVVNSGDITVSGKTVGDVVVLGENITHSGTIKANAIRGRGGNIELHANTTTKVIDDGRISANAEQGGDIKLLGENVGLFDQAAIAAIGEKGGGRVLLGGDQEGLNPQIRNAEFAYISENSNINASAIHAGDGGVAIIFAEDTARIYGNLSAKGGVTGGDGGFIETSGKRGFSIANTPDVSAAKGNGGSWLIDPYNITIASQGPNEIPDDGIFTSGVEAALVVDSIIGALERGTNVTVKTEEDGGNITVDSPITATIVNGVTLNLIANNNINIRNKIEADGSGSLSLYLFANNTSNSNNKGSVNFSDDASIKTNGGNFVIGALSEDGSLKSDVVGTTNVDFSGVSINTESSFGVGGFFVNASGKVTLGDMSMFNDGGHYADLTILAKQLIFHQGQAHLNGQNIKLEAAEWRVGDKKDLSELELKAHAGSITLTVSESDLSENDLSGMRLETRETGSITLNFHFTSSGSSNEFKLPKLNSSENITLNGVAADEKGFVLFNKEIDEHYWRSPSWQEFSLGGVLTLDLGEKGSATIGNIVGAQSLAIKNGNDINLKANGSISLGDVTLQGALTLSSGSDILQQEGTAVTVSGPSSFSSVNGSIILDQEANIFGSFNTENIFTSSTVSIGGRNIAAVNIASEQDLLLHQNENSMAQNATLELHSKGNISQLNPWSVTGMTTLSAVEDIMLAYEGNNFSKIEIKEAKSASIVSYGDLELGSANVTETLTLSCIKHLTQDNSATLTLGALNLNEVEKVTLSKPGNTIGELYGSVKSGEISVEDLLTLGDFMVESESSSDPFKLILSGDESELSQVENTTFTVKSNAIVNAAQVIIGGEIELENANLTINEVNNFTLNGNVHGNGYRSQLLVQGPGESKITEAAKWSNVGFILDGGGDGSLQGPNLEASWRINTDSDTHTLSPEQQGDIFFRGMSVLKGGDKDDTFTFHGGGDNAKQFSKICGGGGENTLDYSGVDAEVTITVGDSSQYVSKIANIQVLVGNGDSATLHAPDNATSEWVIGDGENNRIEWTLNEASTVETDESVEPVVPIESVKPPEKTMAFRGFDNLIGGTGKDDFRVKLHDHLGHYKFDGGGDNVAVDGAPNAELNDELSIEGGGADWWGTYGVDQNGVPGFSFSSSPQSEDRTNLSYQGIESVNVEAVLGYVELRDETERGEFHLSPGKWQWGGQTSDFTPVSYSAALKGLIVYANTISLAGSIHLPERLDLEGKILSVDEAVLLKAGHLHLEDFNGGIGSDKAPLDISVDNLTLSLADDAKAVYLREEDGVTLAGLNGGGLVDLRVESGDLSQHDAIDKESGVLILQAVNGAIQLDHESNSIDAPITLVAATTASLRTKGDLQLAKVSAKDLLLTATGSIASKGSIIVNNVASFVSGKNIDLISAGNELNYVTISPINNDAKMDVHLASNGNLRVFNSNVHGKLDLTAGRIYFLGLTNADKLVTKGPEVWVTGLVLIEQDVQFNGAFVEGLEFVHSKNGEIYGARKLSAADRMIEIEELTEIDPAIFTNVKNYVYQDVSIRLPSDQLYEEMMAD